MMNRDLKLEGKERKGVGGERKEKEERKCWKTYRELETELVARAKGLCKDKLF